MRGLRYPALLMSVVVVIGLMLYFAEDFDAKPGRPSEILTAPEQAGIANETCLECHALPDQYYTLPSGEKLYLTIDEETFNRSVHGSGGYACVQCHTDITGYPHPQLSATTLRDVSLSLYKSCARCHQEKYDASLDSVHQKALAAGNREAAICTDCHGAHDTQPPDEPYSQTAKICERCHSQIYEVYQDSVHGEALIGEGNPDVPSCIDCHGVHNVQGPSTNSEFHLYSPLLCADCHDDPELMEKYGINTEVFDTYLSDFHGTSVALFEPKAPGQIPNKPVCVDCHGHHNIKSPDDPESTVMKENLLVTCQRCHPDATADFSSAWLGHYTPDQDTYPLMYYVDLFYKIFIPLILIPMAIYVVTDFSRKVINRRKESKHA